MKKIYITPQTACHFIINPEPIATSPLNVTSTDDNLEFDVSDEEGDAGNAFVKSKDVEWGNIW